MSTSVLPTASQSTTILPTTTAGEENWQERFKQIFDPSLDNPINVLALTPHDPLDTFVEMWYQIFLWALFSSMLFHCIAAVVGAIALRHHSPGRCWIPTIIIAMGIISPCTAGIISSAVIAWAFKTSSMTMSPFVALLAGCTQSIAGVIVSFSRLPATL